MSYECKICNAWFNDHISFSNHIKKVHGISVQAYYDTYLKRENEGICKQCGKPTKYYGLGKGYSTYCSSKCSNIANSEINIDTTIECKLCNQQIASNNTSNTVKSFTKHLQKNHNIYDPKIYYDSVIKKENEGICPLCKGETKFKSVISGYDKFCSVSCQQNYQKNITGSHTNKIHIIANIRNYVTKMAAAITEKYTNFIKNDRHAIDADIRTDHINTVKIKDNNIVDTIDGKREIKTEISCSTSRDPWIGSQHKYIPKLENCDHNSYKNFNDDIIENDEINSNEWC